jgi:integrase
MSVARRKIPGKPPEEWPLVIRYTGRDGRWHTETIKSGLKKDAQRRLREIEIEKEKGIHVPKSQTENMAFLFRLWLEHYETLVHRGFKARSTFLNYERDVRLHLLPEFGGMLITRFEALQAQHFVDQLMRRKVLLRDGSGKRDPNKQYSISRLKQITIPLKLALDFAMDHKLVGRNVLADRPIRLPEMPDSNRQWMQVDDARKILRALNARRALGTHSDDNALLWRNQRLLIVLLMFTGIREAEACGLQWANVDLSRHVLHIRHQMGRDGIITERLKSKKAKRTIPINPLLYQALVNHAPRVEDRIGTVIRNTRGEPMRMSTVISKIIPKVMERAGLVDDNGRHRFTAHQLRHFAGSVWLAEGMRLDQVSRLLGHSSTSITEKIYIHEQEHDTQAAEVIARVAGIISGTPVDPMPVISPASAVPMIEQRAAVEFDLPAMVESPPPAPVYTTKGHREIQRQRAVELSKDRSSAEIARELGVSQITVIEWIQEANGNLKRSVKRAAQYEKLTPEEREERNRKQREYYQKRRQKHHESMSRNVTSKARSAVELQG